MTSRIALVLAARLADARASHDAHLLDLALRRAECWAMGLNHEDFVPADPVFDEEDYRPIVRKRYG